MIADVLKRNDPQVSAFNPQKATMPVRESPPEPVAPHKNSPGHAG